ncbi:rho guanine nucleotide exchange factor 7 [Caerostris extrusa]|uniref:Rho guanine nucleotide exchange factor 7 n=1 Tax=Caerostris extrusa TaxID=172846 RepID=A0AAV4WVH5_CAEEX|nr:rho guanine nucleotide exchange factor 7 [Caerostris extrusa]
MITDSPVHLVKAVFNYKATNNDELCLKKGDVITVTQALEGGWWEGTLNGVTGWFLATIGSHMGTRGKRSFVKIQVDMKMKKKKVKEASTVSGLIRNKNMCAKPQKMEKQTEFLFACSMKNDNDE